MKFAEPAAGTARVLGPPRRSAVVGGLRADAGLRGGAHLRGTVAAAPWRRSAQLT